MRSLAEIGAVVELEECDKAALAHAGELLRLGEEVLENWVAAKKKAAYLRRERRLSSSRFASPGCQIGAKFQCVSRDMPRACVSLQSYLA